MAKKIRQAQIEGQIVQSVTGAGVNNTDPKNPVITALEVTGISITGTTTKTIRITFSDDSYVEGSFSDLNTTYTLMTLAQMTTGTDTTGRLISAKNLNDWIGSLLGAVMTYKGQKANYTDLPAGGNKTGDTWNIQNAYPAAGVKAGDNVAWNGSEWDVLSGTIDTSVFLTEEVDPKGVKEFTLDSTPFTHPVKLKIELNDETVKEVTLPFLTAAHLTNSENNAVGTIRAKDYYGAWQTLFSQKSNEIVSFAKETVDVHVVDSTDIDGNEVTLDLSNVPHATTPPIIYMNGVRQPADCAAFDSQNVVINQTKLPCEIIVGDEIEIVYRNNPA